MRPGRESPNSVCARGLWEFDCSISMDGLMFCFLLVSFIVVVEPFRGSQGPCAVEIPAMSGEMVKEHSFCW